MDEKNYSIGVFVSNDKLVLNKYKDSLEKKVTLEIFNDVEDSIEYLIKDNLNISFCIIDCSSAESKKIFSFIDKVHRVNNLIKIILVEVKNDFEKENKANIEKYSVESYNNRADTEKVFDYVFNMISNLKDAKRKYSRVNWPLNVNITFLSDKKKPRIERHILSISGNGAYICSDDHIPAKDEKLNLNITFKDFKLMTEALVVWTNEDGKKSEYPCGFAVSFIDIGHISQKIIDDIIKDKLLQEILVDMKHV